MKKQTEELVGVGFFLLSCGLRKYGYDSGLFELSKLNLGEENELNLHGGKKTYQILRCYRRECQAPQCPHLFIFSRASRTLLRGCAT